MSNRTLELDLVIGAALAIIGVVTARLLQALLPPDAINGVVAVFFTICVLAMGALVAAFTLRRR